jgi:serine/threonine protein kinase
METTLEADVVLADRYRLVKPIGRGGYSVVWVADHVVTGKRVALKVLTKRGDEPASRFLREARITARIDHPDVVNIHDLFQLDDSDALVMVMDLLEGVSLAERLRRSEDAAGPAGAAGISFAETAHIVLSVASALEAAHALGVVHRDLKPENVFLTNDGRVRVLDFGVAKWIHPEPEALLTPDLTETGAIVGTPHYMAPEQVFGERDVDGRADVWALGVIAYECLAGARPIDGDNFGQVCERARPPFRRRSGRSSTGCSRGSVKSGRGSRRSTLRFEAST